MAMDRRRVLTAAGVSAAAVAGLSHASYAIQHPHVTKPQALEQDHIRVAAVQSAVTLDRQTNLSAMLRDIDRLSREPAKPTLIAFHALALQGVRPRTIEGARQCAIGMDGPDIATLCRAAQTSRAYIAFGALTIDADWPGHVIARNILLGPDGRVVSAPWQATHDAAAPFLTSAESVIEDYTTRYGADAVLPVISTAIGNVALTSDFASPEIYRALALKGADVIVRLSTQSAPAWDAQASAAYNQVFVVAPLTAADLRAAAQDDPLHGMGGGSVIVGPRGEILAEAGSRWSQTLSANLPVAHLRASRQKLDMHGALVMPTFTAHA
jgi:predicted amidohydrolase